MAQHNEIGKIGENITKTFLMKHGFSILDTNYHVKIGEIDIVAQKDGKLHFIEVKSVKVRNFESIQMTAVQPEDNLTTEKWKKIVVAIEIYLRNKNVPHVTPRQIDLACVYINPEAREGRVVLKENIYKE